jgi:hypothetical protein
LEDILSKLPSKIAFSLFDVELGDGRAISLPRRELWDVRVQLMAEENTENSSDSEAGLGEHDVKTGIYEGGFKSWESSADLVKVLAAEKVSDLLVDDPCIVIEVRALSPIHFPYQGGCECADLSCSLVAAQHCLLSLSSIGPWPRESPSTRSPWCSHSQTTTLPYSIL